TTGTRGLGRCTVNGRSRLPSPPAITTAFMRVVPPGSHQTTDACPPRAFLDREFTHSPQMSYRGAPFCKPVCDPAHRPPAGSAPRQSPERKTRYTSPRRGGNLPANEDRPALRRRLGGEKQGAIRLRKPRDLEEGP